jgi:hypothetical protein
MEKDFQELAKLLSAGKIEDFSKSINAHPLLSGEQASNLLLMLIGSCEKDWLPILVKAGADVNFVGDEGQTPLSECVHTWAYPDRVNGPSAKKNALSNAIELLSLGSSPNSSYMGLFSVTALAVSLNAPELALAFLFAGASLNEKEPDEYSSDSLREVMRKSVLPWPSQLLSIIDRNL